MKHGVIVSSIAVVLAGTAGFLHATQPGVCPERSVATETRVSRDAKIVVESMADVESPAQLIALFAHAYRSMDLALYGELLAHEPGQGVGFRFVLNRPTAAGETDWGYAEEMRIHRRMFRPQSITSDEKPLPRELWVRSIEVGLLPVTDFRERFDLYISEHNPMGELDRKRWRAADAVYATHVTWWTEGGATMSVRGQARFIVIEDLLQPLGGADKFLIYRWEDLGAGEVGVAQSRR